MIEIRNLLFQPLTFHLVGEERGLHLRARQRICVAEESVSEEMQLAENRGFISIEPIEETLEQATQQPDTLPENVDAVIVEATQALPESEAQAESAETADSETVTKKRR